MDEDLRRQTAKVCWQIAKETAKMHLTQAKIKLYEDSFNHMKNCTGKDDIKDVVMVFKESEETNQNL